MSSRQVKQAASVAPTGESAERNRGGGHPGFHRWTNFPRSHRTRVPSGNETHSPSQLPPPSPKPRGPPRPPEPSRVAGVPSPARDTAAAAGGRKLGRARSCCLGAWLRTSARLGSARLGSALRAVLVQDPVRAEGGDRRRRRGASVCQERGRRRWPLLLLGGTPAGTPRTGSGRSGADPGRVGQGAGPSRGRGGAGLGHGAQATPSSGVPPQRFVVIWFWGCDIG